MKLLKTADRIYSMEDVRTVSNNTYTTNHVSRGSKYEVVHHHIHIGYTDGHNITIECGEDGAGKAMSDKMFNDIFEILSKD